LTDEVVGFGEEAEELEREGERVCVEGVRAAGRSRRRMCGQCLQVVRRSGFVEAIRRPR
jgi:hypothetical protein